MVALSWQGYITHGVWVPEFILEQPDVLKTIHYEMAHAGSNVMEAFQVSLSKSKLCMMSSRGVGMKFKLGGGADLIFSSIILLKIKNDQKN